MSTFCGIGHQQVQAVPKYQFIGPDSIWSYDEAVTMVLLFVFKVQHESVLGIFFAMSMACKRVMQFFFLLNPCSLKKKRVKLLAFIGRIWSPQILYINCVFLSSSIGNRIWGMTGVIFCWCFKFLCRVP